MGRDSKCVEEGDTVIVYVQFGVAQATVAMRGQVMQSKFGALRHDFMIGQPYGSRISSTKGYVYILRPSPELWTETLSHRTQILYPPDMSLITHLLEIRPGSKVAEAGTGSAALSYALLRTISPHGFLHTFDVDPSRVEAARTDLARHGFEKNVSVCLRNVCSEQGFGLEKAVDAVFLDLPQPWDAVEAARSALSGPGARFVSFSPCIEQVQRTCVQLRASGFTEISTVEIVPRQHRISNATRLSLVAVGEGDGGGPRTKKRRAADEGVEESETTTHFVFPWQQPTHTGYLTSATLA